MLVDFALRHCTDPDSGNRLSAVRLEDVSPFTDDFYLSLALSLWSLEAIGTGFKYFLNNQGIEQFGLFTSK